ncbi:hypothetical protein Hamer_G028346 [Homarus americanus]|uniref:Uncharacterized protein n=1 Tax=Homarus americanus TaxID=6706 RepID=A0A8J5TF01_HOMAM|nr:hypothetical protein Hamer_G028346 [Homarus americanus]
MRIPPQKRVGFRPKIG